MVFVDTLIAVLAMMFVVWLISLVKNDVSIVDAFWGPGFLLVAAVAWAAGQGFPLRGALLLALVGIWALRLGLYLLWRNLQAGEEDYRYRKMRERWGAKFPAVSLGTIFFFQGLLVWFISLPLQVTELAAEPRRLTWLDGLGVALWLIGFVFESVGDWQLARFKADPANQGKVLDHGLWRYTRHPNYFGDFMIWWGFFAIALATMLWHRVSAKPQPQEALKPWERAAAAIAHVVLLTAALLIPITGYIATTSAGEGVSFFGFIDIPALLSKHDGLRDFANAVHFYLSYGLVAVVLLHAGAALKHQFIDGHDTLRRMLDR